MNLRYQVTIKLIKYSLALKQTQPLRKGKNNIWILRIQSGCFNNLKAVAAVSMIIERSRK